MQRILALTLSTLLLLGLCIPAMGASESADERLARVTRAVKETLELDTEQYTDFRGDVREEALGSVWSLRWSGESASLNIEALEDGTVVSYWRSGDEENPVVPYRYYGAALPSLPKLDPGAAKQSAEAFLARVLDQKTESAALSDPAVRLGSTVCSFSGFLLLNGLPSPLSYSITVRGSDNAVTSFRRDALAVSFLGNIPSASPAVSRDEAAATLKETIGMELRYVTDENDPSRAVLRYVQVTGGERYVDAQTGKLVDPSDDMVYGVNSRGMAEDAEAEVPMAFESAKNALTEVELSGVEKLEGVLDRDALDKLVRAESAYKLDGYTVASANYRVVKDGEAETVLCTLRYASPEDEIGFSRSRTFTLDGRSGAVQSLYSYAPWDKDAASALSAGEAREQASAFFSRFFAHAAEFELRESEDHAADGSPFYGFTFVRKVNGVFFPEDSCSIRVDRTDGAIAGISLCYSEGKTFDAAGGVVSARDALDSWMGSFDVVLAYRAKSKPLSADVPLEAKLIDCGCTRFRTLLLTYALEREGWFAGVDAKTGKLVSTSVRDREIAYGDVSGNWAENEIETLARFGIGYASASFLPAQPMTQWELVALLASVQGMCVDPANASAEERDSAYAAAYRLGALTKDEREDDRALTRGALVRCLIGCTDFAAAAKLSGIYTCSFADRADIPESDLPYAAFAQALGLVRNERYDAAGSVSRAAAAVMLYRVMER